VLFILVADAGNKKKDDKSSDPPKKKRKLAPRLNLNPERYFHCIYAELL